MAQEQNPSPVPSNSSSYASVDSSPRCAPTSIHPTPRYNLRTKFKSLHSFATIVVGSESSKGRSQTTYTVHRDLLTSASPFFAAALNGTFAEGFEQRVNLPEEKPEIFEWFIWWLYTGSLHTPGTSPSCCGSDCSVSSQAISVVPSNNRFGLHMHHNAPISSPASASSFSHTDGDLRNSAGSPKYFLLLDLYALSDRLLTTPLSNHIIDTIARLSESTNSVPTPSDTWILYGDDSSPPLAPPPPPCSSTTTSPTSPSSVSTMPTNPGIRDTAPVRTLILDLFAYKKTDKLLETHRDEWHPRFLRDLVVKLKRPGAENRDRHALVPWRPASWPATRPCESCRELLRPGIGGVAGNAGGAGNEHGHRGGGGGGGGEFLHLRNVNATTTGAGAGGAGAAGGGGGGGGAAGGVSVDAASSSAAAAAAAGVNAATTAGGEKCQVCDRVFCALCLRSGRLPVVAGEAGVCKPWLRGLCARYHEHPNECDREIGH